MRVLQGRPESESNPLRVYAVRWHSRNGKAISSGIIREREHAVSLYERLDAKGREPWLVITHVAGFLF